MGVTHQSGYGNRFGEEDCGVGGPEELIAEPDFGETDPVEVE